ncbi:ABC transporter ATP-binding protein [Dermabacteraceae bacterium P7074]
MGASADSLSLSKTFHQARDFFSKGEKIGFSLIALASVFLGLLETVGIVSIVPLIDLASGRNSLPPFVKDAAAQMGIVGDEHLGLALVVLVIGIFIVKDVASIYFNWLQLTFVAKRKAQAQARMMAGYMSLPWQAYRRHSVAEMMRIVNDAVPRVYGGMALGIVSLISSFMTVLLISCALLLSIPTEAVAVGVYFFVGAGIYLKLVRPRIVKSGKMIEGGSKEAYSSAMHALGAYKEISLRHTEGYFTKKYSDATKDLSFAVRDTNFYNVIPKFLLEILFISAVGMILCYLFMIGNQESIVSSLALMVAAGFRMLPNISSLIASASNMQVGAVALDLVYKNVKLFSLEMPEQRDELSRLPFRNQIELRNVCFKYEDSKELILNDISLVIPHGSSIAFVGGSGAGKTTLVDVLLGLLAPTSGEVLIDGVDMFANARSWQENAAMVSQDVYMSDRSMRDNIVFDQPFSEVDVEKLENAISRAQLTDLIDDLPEGLDTLCGERGARLSGGQRQRVGICRALYRSPSLLVLDEATSALDNETEKKITDTIDGLSGEVTVVVVAHRLSTVKNVDQVVYLESGKVAGVGTFAYLRDNHEGFARLVELGKLEA